MTAENLHTKSATTKPVNSSKEAEQEGGDKLDAVDLSAGFSLAHYFLAFLAMTALLVCTDPNIRRWWSHRDSTPLPIGVVQSVSFVGRLGRLDTQVNTDQQTILLKGAVALPKGIQLEWRRNQLSNDLCVVGEEQCWDLLVGGATPNKQVSP